MVKSISGIVFEENEHFLEVQVSGKLQPKSIKRLFDYLVARYPATHVLFRLQYDVHIDLDHREIKELFAKTRSIVAKRPKDARVAIHTAKLGDYLLLKFAAELYNNAIERQIRIFQVGKEAEDWAAKGQ